jgi:hypothetical protein
VTGCNDVEAAASGKAVKHRRTSGLLSNVKVVAAFIETGGGARRTLDVI